jgi:hypothetical protein
MTGRRTDAKIANGYLQKTANQDYAKAKPHVGSAVQALFGVSMAIESI